MTALSFEEARDCVIRTVTAQRILPSVEFVPLELAASRILAGTVAADRDYPPTARSVRDGYALKAADLPGEFEVTGEVRAGTVPTGEVGSRQAIEIMTGAAVPLGADAVVMVEHAERDGARMTTARTLSSGENINPQGWECRSGDTILEPGTRLDYGHIAALAMTGHATVAVYRRPRVAILSTGDEVLDIAATPEPHQIRNSNAWSLAEQVRRAGGEPLMLDIARDNHDDTRRQLEEGLRSDLLLISGGVSAGKYDIVEQALSDCGAEFFFTRVRIQPGQPLVFGSGRGKFFFGLPGNPASTMVTFEVFARAALELLAGQTGTALPLFRVPLARDFQQRSGLTRFLPATLSADGSSLTPINWKGSGDVASIARANAYLVSDPARESYAAGDLIRALPR